MQPRTARTLAATLAVPAVALIAATAGGATGHGSVPAPPTGVTAAAALDGATVSFAGPAGPSGASSPTSPTGASGTTGPSGPTGASGTTVVPATSYKVTASPGNEQTFGATSPIAVGGLQPGAAYTFTVTPANAAGTGLPSAPAAAVTTLAPPAGTTPPVLSALKVSLISFIAASHGGPMTPAAGTGTTLSYSDSTAASVTVDVIRVRDGFERGGACLVQAVASGKRCTSFLLLGTFTAPGTAGANSIHFSGRLNGRTLAAGVYQLRLTATANAIISNSVKVPIDVF